VAAARNTPLIEEAAVGYDAIGTVFESADRSRPGIAVEMILQE
jgi:hypothetical protein